jgi:cellulose synthase (UDP-forming)
MRLAGTASASNSRSERRPVGFGTDLRRFLVGGFWCVLSAGIVALSALPVDLRAQATFGAVALLTLVILRRWRQAPFARILALLVMLELGLRYMFWRTDFTLVYAGFFSFIGTILLYAAEVYGFLIFLLGLIVNLSPISRAVTPVDKCDDSNLPSVDVVVPSYNEEPDLLCVTLAAAAQIRYPTDKLAVHLLDDGGTVEKRSDPDPAKAAAAQVRHLELRDLSRRFGVRYLTRERNRHAKAGNMNEALPKIYGDLILILDADHVPTADILEKTVGFFQRDSKLFLVQTPHFFINPDPIERNLNTFADMPGENEMFYRVIQKGLDFWNASFFCGSAALLRRACLDEIGGFSHQSITEDAETALMLHARGYRSAYLGWPMVAGLAPETFSGFVTQRMRWAQGMVQIFMLRNPLFIRGLTVWQRLCYLSDSLFWFFPFARLVYLLAPTAYLFFGLKIYHASAQQFLAYALPYFIASLYATNIVFGRTRWPFVSYVYELIQSVFSLNAVWRTLRNPRAPSFKVTPKGERLDRDYLSPLARPFFRMFLVLNLAMAAGFYRIYFGNPLEAPVVIVTMLWNLFNYVIILAALGALYERRQLRRTHRMPANLPAELTREDGTVWQGRVVDLSMGGARFRPDRKRAPILKKSSRDPVYADEVREIFAEAREDLALNRSPARIVANCRRVLDVSSKKLNARGDTLSDRMDDLRARGILIQPLVDWVTAGRIDVKQPAHGLVASREEAREWVEFVEAFLEVAFALPAGISERLQPKGRLTLRVENPSRGQPSRFDVIPRHRSADGLLGLSFEVRDDQVFREVVSLVHGSSERWAKFWDSRLKPVGIWRSLLVLTLRGVANFGRYLFEVVSAGARNAEFLPRHIKALPGYLAAGALRWRDTWTDRLAKLRHIGEGLYIIESKSSKA